MCEHQVGGDVARERAIAVGIEEAVHRRELAAGACIERRRLIAHVRRGAGAARDEPAAEAALEWIALIDEPRQADALHRIRSRRAEHQQAGYAQRVAGHVAAETDERALELR